MANTSRTMANRKRPPPTNNNNGNASTNNNNGTPAAQHQQQQQLPLPSGIDTLLAKYARHLPPGGTITIQLIKGPSTTSVDPIAARRAAAKDAAKNKRNGGGSGNDSDDDNGGAKVAKKGKGITVPLTFPRIAKFNETVTAPDFVRGSLRDGRFYEEEVPLAKDESDEEESTAYKPVESNGDGTNTDPNNNTGGDAAKSNKKKKRRWRRHAIRPRRWVLQEKAEFVERIRKRKQRSSSGGGGDDDDDDEQGISNQYHGVVESNASKYVMLSVAPPPTVAAAATTMPPSTPSSQVATEQISIQPIHGFHTFSQPYKLASLTMEEAENAIERQRNVVTRYMMHGKLSAAASQSGADGSNAAALAAASGVVGGGSRGRGGIGSRSLGPAPKAMSRARLLGKLAGGGGGGGGDGDDDDVMGDVRFSSSSSSRGSSKARNELLSSLGGDGVMVDDDGVLGGANNSEFGGRRRFARVAENKDADGEGKKKGGNDGGGKTSTGFEAGAMEEGFYQRDVAAEYEALDYDANEQFDDDDVNVGEDEMMDDGGGYGGGDFHDSGDDDMLDSDDEEDGSDDDGFRGMATSSGLKAMLAKARGSSPVNASGNDVLDSSSKTMAESGVSSDKSGAGGGGEKGIDKMLDAAKKTAEEMEKKSSEEKKSPPKAAELGKAAIGIEYDKDGNRLITLEAVRREIWLNNGAITSKRLMKKFDATKRNPERQALFKTIVMELCIMKKDADGNKLVLKQHYSKI